jgi:hypothetical protein
MLQLRRRALEAADDVGPAARGASSGATLTFRLQVRPEYRAAYPGVPDGWLRAHRRATDRGAFWLDADSGATPTFPILEPHVDLATIALGAATIAVEERRSR